MSTYRPRLAATSQLRLSYLAEKLAIPQNAVVDMAIGMMYALQQSGALQPGEGALPRHLIGAKYVQITKPIIINLEEGLG